MSHAVVQGGLQCPTPSIVADCPARRVSGERRVDRNGPGIRRQIPVVFGGGRRLFDVLPSRIELAIVRMIDTPQATHIRYRARR